jgi:hypothetical protein
MNWPRINTAGIALILLLVVFSGTVLSSTAAPVRPLVNEEDNSSVSLYLTQMKGANLANLQATDDVDRPPSMDMAQKGKQQDKYHESKSPLKAFLYSTIIPGSGQWYTGSKFKAALFFGVEALTWTGHIVYNNKGNKWTEDFELFANTYWSQDRYEDFLYRNWGVRDDDSVYGAIGLRFTHHLPDTKTQQYFEMIGKYDQFVFGWNDVDTVLTPPDSNNYTVAYSANRMHYENMRHKANQMFDRATASLIVTMANHLISGIDAALSARRHNNQMDDQAQRLTFRAVTAGIDDNYFPMLTMTYTF